MSRARQCRIKESAAGAGALGYAREMGRAGVAMIALFMSRA